MGEQTAGGTSGEAQAVGETFAAARELLARAEEDAARIRADADRYLRQREQEAELLVAKARRVLAVAEQKAASLGTIPPVPHVVNLTSLEAQVPAGGDPIPTGLDGMLKSAIANALERSFHLGS